MKTYNKHRALFRTIILILLFSIYMYVSSQPIYKRHIFVLKYSSLFLFISFFWYIILAWIHSKIIRRVRYSKTKYIIVELFTILIIALFLYNGTNTIKYMAEQATTVYPFHCSYYDDYNNLIYDSQLYYTCPTITEVTKDGNKIHISGYEELDSYAVSNVVIYSYDYEFEVRNNPAKTTVFFDINITYNNNQIQEYIIQKTELDSVIDQGITYYRYKSMYEKILNTYTDTSFLSNSLELLHQEDFQEGKKSFYDEHYNFGEEINIYQQQYKAEYNATDNTVYTTVSKLQGQAIITLLEFYTKLDDNIILTTRIGSSNLFHFTYDYSDNKVTIEYPETSVSRIDIQEFNVNQKYRSVTDQNKNIDTYYTGDKVFVERYSKVSEIKPTNFGFMVMSYSDLFDTEADVLYQQQSHLSNIMTENYIRHTRLSNMDYVEVLYWNHSFDADLVLPNNPTITLFMKHNN